MKLNIGCGKQTWEGFYCVDAVPHPKATRPLDLVHAFVFEGEQLTNPLPLPDGVASEVHNYHFIEHVYRWESPALLREFSRLLQPGGKLIMELPDIGKCARNLLKGAKDQMTMWGFYGDPGWKDPYMCHRWGYTAGSIAELLMDAGFTHINVLPPKTHGARVKRDMRVEAVK